MMAAVFRYDMYAIGRFPCKFILQASVPLKLFFRVILVSFGGLGDDHNRDVSQRMIPAQGSMDLDEIAPEVLNVPTFIAFLAPWD